MLVCTVCSLWYPALGSDRLEICADCYTQNFAGTQPPLDLHAPPARDTLDAYVDSSRQLSPRQHQALQQIAERWAQEEA